MRRLPVGCLALAVGLAGCRGKDPSGERTPPGHLGYGEVLVLGLEEGEGEIPYQPMDLDVLGDGGYVLSVAYRGPGSLPMHFDREGKFVQIIGREGKGPGEFRAAMVSVPLPGDSLLVHDLLQGRFSVFASDGSARIVRHSATVSDVRVLSWPDSVLTVEWPRGLLGFPYRILSLAGHEAEVLAEFGEPFPTEDPGLSQFRRYISEPKSDRFWAVGGLDYELRQWSLSGEIVRRLDLQSPNFVTEGTGLGPDSVPRPTIAGIEQIGKDTLAVALLVARKDWADAEWEVVGDGERRAYRTPDESELRRAIIEFRGSDSGELFGHQQLHGMVFTFLPDGRVATRDLKGPGFPMVRLYSR